MSKKAAENLLLLEEDSDVDADVMALVGQIYDDEDEKLNDISEAASRTNETYDILQTEDCDPPIILPAHIRLINFNVVIPIFNLIDFFSYLDALLIRSI